MWWSQRSYMFTAAISWYFGSRRARDWAMAPGRQSNSILDPWFGWPSPKSRRFLPKKTYNLDGLNRSETSETIFSDEITDIVVHHVLIQDQTTFCPCIHVLEFQIGGYSCQHAMNGWWAPTGMCSAKSMHTISSNTCKSHDCKQRKPTITLLRHIFLETLTTHWFCAMTLQNVRDVIHGQLTLLTSIGLDLNSWHSTIEISDFETSYNPYWKSRKKINKFPSSLSFGMEDMWY